MNSGTGDFSKLRMLTRAEQRLLFESLLLLPLTGAALRLLGFRRWHAFLKRVPIVRRAARGNDDSVIEQAQKTSRLVRIASERGLYHGRCLHQSIALWWLLRRQGIPGELRIGVRKQKSELLAHAWVETMGIPLNNYDDDTRFSPFTAPIRTRAK